MGDARKNESSRGLLMRRQQHKIFELNTISIPRAVSLHAVERHLYIDQHVRNRVGRQAIGECHGSFLRRDNRADQTRKWLKSNGLEIHNGFN